MEHSAIPDSYLCPITRELMVDPVVGPDGISYERAAITRWLQHNNESPVTRAPMHTYQLAPNFALRDAIGLFHESISSGRHRHIDAALKGPRPRILSAASCGLGRYAISFSIFYVGLWLVLFVLNDSIAKLDVVCSSTEAPCESYCDFFQQYFQPGWKFFSMAILCLQGCAVTAVRMVGNVMAFAVGITTLLINSLIHMLYNIIPRGLPLLIFSIATFVYLKNDSEMIEEVFWLQLVICAFTLVFFALFFILAVLAFLWKGVTTVATGLVLNAWASAFRSCQSFPEASWSRDVLSIEGFARMSCKYLGSVDLRQLPLPWERHVMNWIFLYCAMPAAMAVFLALLIHPIWRRNDGQRIDLSFGMLLLCCLLACCDASVSTTRFGPAVVLLVGALSLFAVHRLYVCLSVYL